jgi:hypothetical protein
MIRSFFLLMVLSSSTNGMVIRRRQATHFKIENSLSSEDFWVIARTTGDGSNNFPAWCNHPKGVSSSSAAGCDMKRMERILTSLLLTVNQWVAPSVIGKDDACFREQILSHDCPLRLRVLALFLVKLRVRV